MITAVDGRRVLKPQDVTSAVNLKRPGDTLAITYARAGKAAEAKLELP